MFKKEQIRKSFLILFLQLHKLRMLFYRWLCNRDSEQIHILSVSFSSCQIVVLTALDRERKVRTTHRLPSTHKSFILFFQQLSSWLKLGTHRPDDWLGPLKSKKLWSLFGLRYIWQYILVLGALCPATCICGKPKAGRAQLCAPPCQGNRYGAKPQQEKWQEFSLYLP